MPDFRPEKLSPKEEKALNRLMADIKKLSLNYSDMRIVFPHKEVRKWKN